MSGLRQRTTKKKRRSVSPIKPVQTNGEADAKQGDNVAVATSIAGALLDYSLPLLLVFGGCCSYVSTLLISPELELTIKSPPAMSGPMRNYFARIPALVCIRLAIASFANSTRLHRTCGHLFTNALYSSAAAALIRDMGHAAVVVSATEADPSPHLAMAPPRHHVRVWDAAQQHRICIQRPSHNTNHIPFCRYVQLPRFFTRKMKADVSYGLAGLGVSMLLGRIFMGRRYTLQQIVMRFPIPLWRLHHTC